MGRSIGAVFLGVIVASLWIMALEWINSICFPLPAGLQLDDREAVGRALGENSAMLLGVAGAYFVGTCIGGWICGRVARKRRTVHGLAVGLILFGIGIVNLRALPHPAWFWVVGLSTFPIAGALGGLLANRNRRAPTPGFT